MRDFFWILNTLPYRGSCRLSTNLDFFGIMNALPEGAIPRTRAARQFVNSFNSLLRRLRPTNELRRSPQPRCKNSINSNPRRERPERAASPQPRATPWVSVYKRLRPVRAKVWANGWLLLLPLQGVGNGDMVPRALPWAMNLLGFQPAQGRRRGLPRNNIRDMSPLQGRGSLISPKR